MSREFTAGRTTPCAGCPWVVGQSCRSKVELDRHEAAASTFDGSQGFHTVMACHTLNENIEGACIGYLMSDHAYDNFLVRMAAGKEFDPDELHCDKPMYSTYPEMFEAMSAP